MGVIRREEFERRLESAKREEEFKAAKLAAASRNAAKRGYKEGLERGIEEGRELFVAAIADVKAQIEPRARASKQSFRVCCWLRLPGSPTIHFLTTC